MRVLNDVKMDPRDAATSIVPHQPCLQGWALAVTRGWTMTVQGCWFSSDERLKSPCERCKDAFSAGEAGACLQN